MFYTFSSPETAVRDGFHFKWFYACDEADNLHVDRCSWKNFCECKCSHSCTSFKHRNTAKYGGVEVQLQAFRTSQSEESDTDPQKSSLRYLMTRSQIGPKRWTRICTEEKGVYPSRESNRSPVLLPISVCPLTATSVFKHAFIFEVIFLEDGTHKRRLFRIYLHRHIKLAGWTKSVTCRAAGMWKCLHFQLKDSIVLLWRRIILSFIHSVL